MTLAIAPRRHRDWAYLALVVLLAALIPANVSVAAVSGSTLRAGDRLYAGDRLESGKGTYKLKMQSDGNLVLRAGGGRALWSSRTNGKTGASAVMQGDGNFVIYHKGKASWSSKTNGYKGARLTLQNDGNLVVYDANGKARWSSKTRNAIANLRSGQRLKSGQRLESPNGTYRLPMQGDGNLVLYTGSKALWSSRTNGKTGASAVMQGDGNFVVYHKGKAVWSSKTNGYKGARLTLQNDGNLVVYDANGKARWSRRAGSGGRYASPAWLPLRSSASVGCVKTDCNGYHGYWAIDFNTQANAPVHSAGSGKVVKTVNGATCDLADPITNPGNYVVIDHGGGVKTRYLHLASISVAEGQWVTPTTKIGSVGNTGDIRSSRGCDYYHLHYEKLQDGQKVYPGNLRACHGATRVTYPSKLGASNWDGATGTVWSDSPSKC